MFLWSSHYFLIFIYLTELRFLGIFLKGISLVVYIDEYMSPETIVCLSSKFIFNEIHILQIIFFLVKDSFKLNRQMCTYCISSKRKNFVPILKLWWFRWLKFRLFVGGTKSNHGKAQAFRVLCYWRISIKYFKCLKYSYASSFSSSRSLSLLLVIVLLWLFNKVFSLWLCRVEQFSCSL